MQRISLSKVFIYSIAFLVTGAVFAQEDEEGDIDTERLIIVKPYSPTVSDAFKVKQMPVINDSTERRKKAVVYDIFSFPVASTFTPAKGKAEGVTRKAMPRLYDNYASLGFGNYSNVAAEFYSTINLDRGKEVSIGLVHNSSQGGIDEARLDDKYYDTGVEIGYKTQGRDLTWGVDAGFQHQLYNWYGIPDYFQPDETELAQMDPQHSYYAATVGAHLDMEEGVFDGAKLKYRRFGDNFGSGENHVKWISDLEFPVVDQVIGTEVSFDFVNGNFDKGYENLPVTNQYGFFNMGIAPSIQIGNEDLSVNLGAQLVYSMDIENEDNNLFLYPRVSGSYRVSGDYFIAYAGAEGELKQNTYYEFAQQNPFVSPTLSVAPTDKQYDIYLGGKGKFSDHASYNIRGSYTSEANKPMFLHNPYVEASAPKEGYENFNSFGVVYDDVTTLSFFGELQFSLNEDVSLRINGTYNNYSADEQEEVWNLPELEGSLALDYQITEKWFAGASVFAVGERDVFLDFQGLSNTYQTKGKMDAYIDANLRVGYKINDRLSLFLRGNNLLTENYRPWLGYPTQGIQVMGGVSYQFDW
ncbi:MAG: TonB-dependent receptor [Mesonia sp.]|uniref:TonB-dependent receptor n=1 Tax=Mesonia sp. TaxID=1960830 RepID=UPI003F9D8F41